ncbi:hypothetical protein Tco_0318776 [Tanacetum coccineum]
MAFTLSVEAVRYIIRASPCIGVVSVGKVPTSSSFPGVLLPLLVSNVLLSKKTQILQCPTPTRTHVPTSYAPSQKDTPSLALMSPPS